MACGQGETRFTVARSSWRPVQATALPSWAVEPRRVLRTSHGAFYLPRGLCANPPDWSSGTSRRERRAPQSSEGRRSRKGVGGPIPWFITNGGGPADSPFHGVAGTRIRRRVPASQLGKDVHAPSPPWGFPAGKTRGTGGPTGRACLTKRPLTNLHHDLPRARLERGCRFIAP